MRNQTTKFKTEKNKRVIFTVVSIILSIIILYLGYRIIIKEPVFEAPAYEENVLKGIPNPTENMGYQVIDAPTGFSIGLCSTMYQQEDGYLLVYLTNPEINTVNIKCEVKNEDGEILYESGVLKPGEYVERLEPKMELPNKPINIKVFVYGYELDTWYSMGTIDLDNVLQPN